MGLACSSLDPFGVTGVREHYGHLARDSEESIRARLDARSQSFWRFLASDPD